MTGKLPDGNETPINIPPIPDEEDSYLSDTHFCTYSPSQLGGKYKIHAFQSFVPIERVLDNQEIKIVDDIKDNIRWGFDEQLQRTINQERAVRIANGYILNAGKDLKFFPPITVALLPFKDGHPCASYEFAAPGKRQLQNVSGVKIGLIGQAALNRICTIQWDTNRIYAITVDGQHRVAAIRKAYEINPRLLRHAKLAVTFVVMDPESTDNLIGKVRELFIDVNTTPSLVAEERMIFLDDRNILRRVTRSCVAQTEYLGNLDCDWPLMLAPGISASIPIEFLKLRDDKGSEDRGSAPINAFPLIDLFTLHRVVKDFIFDQTNFEELVDILDNTLRKQVSAEAEALDTEEQALDHLDNLAAAHPSIAKALPIYKRYITEYCEFDGDETPDESTEEDDSELTRKEMDDFSFNSITTDSAINQIKPRTSDLVAYAFLNQRWVKNVHSCLMAAPTIKASRHLQVYLQAFLMCRGRDMNLKADAFIKSLTVPDDVLPLMTKFKTELNDMLMKIIKFENPDGNDCSENLLRYSVAQRMLLSHITEVQDLFPDVEGKPPLKYVELYMRKIQALEKIGFFQRNYTVTIGETAYKVWRNILVLEGPNNQLAVKHTDADAEAGWRFLSVVISNTITKTKLFVYTAKKIGAAHLNFDNYKAQLSKHTKKQKTEYLTEKQYMDVERLLTAERKLEEVFDDCHHSACILHGSIILAEFVREINSRFDGN